jgi:hypothetical protein
LQLKALFGKFSYKFNGMYVLILLFVNSDVMAGYKDDIGYTALENEFGTTIPAGGSLSLVTQAEGGLLLDHDGDDQTAKIKLWAPDPAHPEFTGKTINDVSGSPGFYSGHATSVGSRFYGNTNSIAPAIKSIESYLADHWLSRGYLMGGQRLKPLTTKSRVANHSWVGNAGQTNSELLQFWYYYLIIPNNSHFTRYLL